jgi:putative phosphoesterase
MRLVLLADTHLPRGGRRLSPEALATIDAADLVLHAGDFTSVEVFEELAALAPLRGVHGNVDEPVLQARLPDRAVVQAEGVRIGIVHDAGRREGRGERLVAAFPGCAVVLYGHTHQPEVSRHGDVWILNPGSPTERRRAPRRSLLTLDVDGTKLDPRLLPLP